MPRGITLKSTPLIFLTFMLVGVVTYSNTFEASFQFDDTAKIEENFGIRNLSHIGSLLRGHPARFLTYVTFALNYHFGKLNVFGYHLLNILIHIFSSLLVYLLMMLTFKTPRMTGTIFDKDAEMIACFAGLLFLTHPIQTQAVTYIVQRATSLAACFYLGAVILYGKARREGGAFFYGAALLVTFAAMVTKPTAMTLPLVLLLYEINFFGIPKKDIKKRLFCLCPFFLASAIPPYLVARYGTSDFGGLSDITRQSGVISRGGYLLTQVNVIRTYIRLAFFPISQNVDYDYPVAHPMEPQTVFSFLLLAAVLVAAVRVAKKQRLLAFGIFFFFLGLSAESSVYPLSDLIFEHRLYLSMAGFAVFLSTALYLFLKDIQKFTAVSSGIILIFSTATYCRNLIWADEITLWQDTVKKSPKKSRPYNNLGFAYGKKGYYDEAITYCQKALQLDLNDPNAYANLGFLYGKRGDFDKAIEYYQKALQLDPRFVKVYNNLGSAYGKKGDHDKVLEYSRKAIELDSNNADAYSNLAAAYGAKGDYDQEIKYSRKVLQLDPDHAYARTNLGVAYLREGNRAGAREQIDKLRSLPRDDLADQLEQMMQGP